MSNLICEHLKYKTQCFDCKKLGIGGSSLCEHGRRSQCKVCNGSQICTHFRQRHECLECKKLGIGGSSICIHEKKMRDCRECKGTGICPHSRRRRDCVECDGANICTHAKRRNRCKICSPNSNEFCKSCRLFHVVKRNNYLCNYCNPNSSLRQRTKEAQVETLFKTHNLEFINNKQFQNDCCLKYRPDFIMDCNTFYLIIEVDEFAHKSYPQDCEVIRMNNVSMGLGLPVKWIRYNPDKKGISRLEREMTLLQTVQEWSSKPTCDDLNVIYLFY